MKSIDIEELLKLSAEELKNKGFHYSLKAAYEEIKQEGLRGKVGDCSKGALGREVIPKVFFASGLEGAFQIMNRNLNLANQVLLIDLNNQTHMQYVPQSAQDRGLFTSLTPIEAMEFQRRYFVQDYYYSFDQKRTVYEHDLTDEEFDSIQDLIESYEDVPTINDEGDVIEYTDKRSKRYVGIRSNIGEESPVNIRDLIKKIEAERRILLEIPEEERTYEEVVSLQVLNNARAALSMKLRTVVDAELSRLQGQVVEPGNVSRYSFNEDRLELVDYDENIHNCYVQITENGGRAESKRITENDGLAIITQDGKPMSASKAIIRLYEQFATPEMQTTLGREGDLDLIPLFAEYVKIVDKLEERRAFTNLDGGPDLREASRNLYRINDVDLLTEYEERLNKFVKNVVKARKIEKKKPAVLTVDKDTAVYRAYHKDMKDLIGEIGLSDEVLIAVDGQGRTIESLEEKMAAQEAEQDEVTVGGE